MISKLLRIAGAVAVILFVAMQFVRPPKGNRRVDQAMTIEAQMQTPADVKAILDRSCRDCHSDQTDWRWYSAIAPASWLQIADVNVGRSHVNFSRWGEYPRNRQANMLKEVCEQVEQGEMPLWYYRMVHPGTGLSSAEVKTVCDWAKAEIQKLQQ